MTAQAKDSARQSVAPCMGRVPAATQQCRLGPDRSGRGRPAEATCSGCSAPQATNAAAEGPA